MHVLNIPFDREELTRRASCHHRPVKPLVVTRDNDALVPGDPSDTYTLRHMSSRLWETFLQDDVEGFRCFLATTASSHNNASSSQKASTASPAGGTAMTVGSPPIKGGRRTSADFFTSPNVDHRLRRLGILSRTEVNARDQFGRTILHHVASSQKPSALEFARALLDVPVLDIYAQDWESGWTALHRALYVGNATIAQALITREVLDGTTFNRRGNNTGLSLFRIKDREGCSPFDLYGATIALRDINKVAISPKVDYEVASNRSSDDADDNLSAIMRLSPKPPTSSTLGDEVFTFGSNKNLNLGLGHQDDRQFPERVNLRRPEHLLHRFYREYQEQSSDQITGESRPKELPAIIRSKAIKFDMIAMSKLHTAILTDDPESNLFVCGFGPGGRLGTGDESTRFNFVCVETGGLAGRKVVSVALGQDHTLAITDRGGIFSWGSNKYGQLGYNLPRSNNKNDVPMQLAPRQIFNPFKKEVMQGVAASSIHSVVFTSSGLYTFGKNEGQLGLVDSDARSLDVQVTPRRVGGSLFGSPIRMVSAIDRATAVLLQNHEVWVFCQYGYSRLAFPLDASPTFIRNSHTTTRYDTAAANGIVKLKSGGNTICALSGVGEVFTVQVNRPDSSSTSTSVSTTNPVKIRNSLSPPVRAWSVKKSYMAATDIGVGQEGSIIICTNSGSVWQREKRDKRSSDSREGPSKDYKFARVPGLSRVVAVTSNAFGAYAVVQRDCDIAKEQIHVDPSTLLDDFSTLLPFTVVKNTDVPGDQEDSLVLSSVPYRNEEYAAIKRTVYFLSDIEAQVQPRMIMDNEDTGAFAWVAAAYSACQIPVHEFMLVGRSPVLKAAFLEFRRSYYFSIPDLLDVEYGPDGQCRIQFQGVDFLAVLNLVFFLYTDSVLDVWNLAKSWSQNAHRYRQVRVDVMRIASQLGLSQLERAARLMIEPANSLKIDMRLAMMGDEYFFQNADVVIQLNGEIVKAHSHVICRRCPFFGALFHGRSGGRWMLGRRRANEPVHLDLGHIDPRVFDFVMRYMSADMEEQLFDEVRCKDLDEFIDLVLDVIFVANELMIDRLAQICQKMLGRFGMYTSFPFFFFFLFFFFFFFFFFFVLAAASNLYII